MNAKKSLENRIRGWFPQEPKLNVKCQVNSGTPQTSLDFETMRRLGATKLRPIALILIPFIILGISVLSGIATNPHSVFDPTGLIVGVLSGSLVCLFFTGRDLYILAKKGEATKSRKIKVLFALSLNYPWFIFFMIKLVFSLSVGSELIIELTLAHLLSFGIMLTAMNLIWENLNKKRIYFVPNGGLYAIPQTELNPKG